MIPQPTEEQLSLLTPVERRGYALADFWQRKMRWHAELWNSTVMVFLTWLTVKRRLRIEGLEHVRGLDYSRGVCLVANHRTFFDFFTVCCALFQEPSFQRSKILFPVRAKFFYDSDLGGLVNMAMSGMSMFPPISRKREAKDWNLYAIERCAAELRDNQRVVGIHPEGRRSTSEDPFEVHKGKLGIARIVLDVPEAQVVPIFLTGLGNSMLEEARRNWFDAENHPIYMHFGPLVELSDLHAATNDIGAARKATNRCMEAVQTLGEQARRSAARESAVAKA
ncbi:MAG: 1-acyl-sn-glycerol-3-phosphate acyltransferase [Proteobacteria bacterium]|nr:1-acyl-sn-glycerol-3-phosphate acyltransferase [Pseudomonadota bacterium]MCP4917434.1 1-acyl-sn-glycerol-3-phosphate acyltransferase [Pseudomonadota bacterium]